jgi:hypothetical protein
MQVEKYNFVTSIISITSLPMIVVLNFLKMAKEISKAVKPSYGGAANRRHRLDLP